MIRIAFPEATSGDVGGIQYSTFDLIEHLAARADVVRVYYVTQRGTRAHRAACGRDLPAHLVCLNGGGYPGWRHPWWMLRYMWRAWRFLRRERIDVVQGSNETFLLWLLPCLLTRAVPVWNVRAEIQPGFKSALRRRLHGLFCRHLVFVSRAVERSVRAAGGFRRASTTVIRNFVPKQLTAAPPRQAMSEGQLVVGVVGRLDDPVKNSDRAVRIAVRTARNCPGVRFEFWGKAGPATLERLRAAVPADVAGAIRFCGEFREPVRVFRRLDVLLLTSRSEGSPRVILEAGTLGVPVVSTPVGGVPEMVVHGETGLLFDSDQQAETQLAALAANPQLGRRMASAARAHCLSEFGHARVVERYLAFYRQACGESRGVIGVECGLGGADLVSIRDADPTESRHVTSDTASRCQHPPAR